MVDNAESSITLDVFLCDQAICVSYWQDALINHLRTARILAPGQLRSQVPFHEDLMGGRGQEFGRDPPVSTSISPCRDQAPFLTTLHVSGQSGQFLPIFIAGSLASQPLLPCFWLAHF